MTILAASDKLPSNAGYVVAAYLVFLAIILIYVAIMATKLARFEREVGELSELADRLESGPADAAPTPREPVA